MSVEAKETGEPDYDAVLRANAQQVFIERDPGGAARST